MAPPVLSNLRTVSAAWRDEWTGVLVVETPGLGGCSRVGIRAGGLVDVGQSRRLARGITVGVVSFESSAVAGRGDRALLGRVLTAVSRVLSERIRGTLPSEAVVELAMPPERLAGCVAPALVDRLLGRKAVVGALLRDGTATVQELRALGWLGVVRLQRARQPRARRSMQPPVTEQVEAVSSVAPQAEEVVQDLWEGALSPLDGEVESDDAVAAECGIESPEEALEDDRTEESLWVPQVDNRPIPLPPHELQIVAGGEAETPVVHLGMFEPRFDACEDPRLGGVAFGEDQRAEDLHANLRPTHEECLRDDALDDLTDESLLSGLDEELADVLPQEELGLLLGLPGAVARARAREVAPPREPAPPAVEDPAHEPVPVALQAGGTPVAGPATVDTQEPSPPHTPQMPRLSMPRVEVDLKGALVANRGYNLGHLVDPCQIRREGGLASSRRRVSLRGHR